MRFVLIVCVLLTISLTAACGTPEPPTLPPQEIIQNTAEQMNALQGFHYVIDRTGASAYLDPDNALSFRRAEGDYVAPDKTRAVVRVIAPGLVTEVNVISIEAVQWQTNVLTGEWEELPPNWGFNPAVLFDPQIGLSAILQNDLSQTTLVGTEELEGTSTLMYQVTGTITGEALYEMSGTLIGPEPVAVTLWIAPNTFRLHRVVATEPVPGSDEPSVWQVDFTQFDQVIDIEPPAAVNQ